ncbi:MAG: hypothetical protein J6D18_02595 [Erysipelotrichaceae bacterium]|nr:hypothetical protein [Erysipelotrichaceae bacterium]
MNQTIRNKLIFFASFLAMITLLVSVAYLGFLRKVQVDVMSGMVVEYSGENGNASVEITNSGNNINQRAQAFYETVTYEVQPAANLKNGDILHIKASYDQSVADQYNFEPVNTETDLTVEGLVDQYASLDQIDPDYVEEIFREADEYVEDQAGEIFRVEIDDKARNPRLVQTETVYQAFLKSKTLSTDDRMIAIKRLTYEYREQTVELTFMVVVPQINQSNEVQRQDIYGEKVNLTLEEQQGQLYAEYVQRLYQQRFDIQPVPMQQEETEDDASSVLLVDFVPHFLQVDFTDGSEG